MKKIVFFSLIIFAFLLVLPESWGVTLILKNGRQISGTITSEDSEQITIKMEFGKLSFPRNQIEGILRDVTKDNFPQPTPTINYKMKDEVQPTPLLFENPKPQTKTEEKKDFEPFEYNLFTILETRGVYSISRRTPLLVSRRKAGTKDFYANVIEIHQFAPGSKLEILRQPIEDGEHSWYFVSVEKPEESTSARGWISSRFLLDQTLQREK